MKKILIAVDDSAIAEKVVSTGFDFCEKIDADIALLSVVDTSFLMTDGEVTISEMALMEKIDYKKIHDLLIGKILNGNKTRTFIEEGIPSETILKTADEWGADMIILGTHGRSGLAHLFMGSVAEKVIRNSRKPLLIVPVKQN